MNKIYIIFSLFLILVLLSSCASITNGSYAKIDVYSEPKKAIIFVNGVEIGETPAELQLKRGADYVIEIKSEGYAPHSIIVKKQISSWFFGNLISFGFLGLIIDLSNGNAYDLNRRVINVKLNKDNTENTIYLENEFEELKIYDHNKKNICTIKLK